MISCLNLLKQLGGAATAQPLLHSYYFSRLRRTVHKSFLCLFPFPAFHYFSFRDTHLTPRKSPLRLVDCPLVGGPLLLPTSFFLHSLHHWIFHHCPRTFLPTTAPARPTTATPTPAKETASTTGVSASRRSTASNISELTTM